MNFADVLDVNRRAVFDFEHDIFDVGDAFEITAAAHKIFRGRDLESFSAYVAVARLHAINDIAQRNAVREKRVWIDIDLVFLDETADRRDFGDAFHGFKRVAQVPILNRTQLRQVELVRIVDERVLVNPAHSGRVWPDCRVHAFRQRAADRVQVFNDARTRPINVGSVLEDYVDERFTEHRFAADKSYLWSGNETCGNRISDLVLYEIG